MPYAISTRFNKPVKIYYEDLGDHNLPILIMQHGDGNSSEDWKSLGYTEKLTAHLRIVMIDYLGFGQSDKIYDANAYTMPLLASDTIAVIKHANIKKPVTFFGGSMGGRVGYELATSPSYAYFFNGFIINGSGPSSVDVTLDFAKWASIGGMEYVIKMIEQALAPLIIPEGVRRTFLSNNVKSYIAANSNIWPDISHSITQIDKPVLLICGELADERKDMEKSASLIKNTELKVLPQMNHAEAYWYGHQQISWIIDFVNKCQT